MGRITKYQMSYLLSISTHRAKYPVVGWVENRMKKENKTDWNGWLGYGALECVNVILGDTRLSYTLDQDLRVESLFDVGLESVGEPSKEDLDFLEVVYPEEFKSKFQLCHKIKEIFDRPHSCLIQPEYSTGECRCGKTGIVNCYSGYGWEYYCGGSPRCTP